MAGDKCDKLFRTIDPYKKMKIFFGAQIPKKKPPRPPFFWNLAPKGGILGYLVNYQHYKANFLTYTPIFGPAEFIFYTFKYPK